LIDQSILVYRCVVVKTAELTSGEFLSLVGDPQRWDLLTALSESDRRVGELSALTGRSQSLVSYHLGQLRSAGQVSSRLSSADGRDTNYPEQLGLCRELFGQATASLHPRLALVPMPALTPPPHEPALQSARRPKVQFLCTGNSARSQMAEALLETRSGGTVGARSAGSHPKALHPLAVHVMAERGIDIAGRQTKHLSRFARTRFDRVITLCDKVKEVCPEFPGRPATAHWSIADPAAAAAEADADEVFVRTADEIDERIGLLIAHLQPVKERP
jgi:protein-tyrosine-phosphatase/DNA-binding transcriptional ArsR family regulator